MSELILLVAPRSDAYSPGEIALAAGVAEEQVVAMLGGRAYASYAEALAVACAVRREARSSRSSSDLPLFSIFAATKVRQSANRVPLALSSSVHFGIAAAIVLIATFATSPNSTMLAADERAEPLRLVFLAVPGPGGGGGGGGLLQKAPPPKALREGREPLNSPLPVRVPPRPVEATAAPPEPKPPLLDAESLPVVVAPIVTAPADSQNRIGVLDEASAANDSHGPGRSGGAGSGEGSGLGRGEGPGVGPGSGGGFGGGPYRPGSGIQPPRLLHEVPADYTESARQRGITGEVLLEIVVRRDGSVGEIKILKGLGEGLNDRAVQAVRQWRFAAAQRQGVPVDVIVEVAVEFRLR
jgi:protein TonB